MQQEISNFENCQVFPNTFVSGQNPVSKLVSLRSDQQRWKTSGKPIFSVETCVQIELSLVKEVEAVFIDRESDGEFRIISVVNERDAAIREKVYAREEEIMAAYPGVKFDFHVLARMNRKLEDVITKAGKTVFGR